MPEPAEIQSLPDQILSVPEPVWRKIATFLNVKTRQEAVQLVQANEEAAVAVTEIIRSYAPRKSALTETPRPRSALTDTIPETPVADRLYGGGGKAKLRIG